MAQPTLVRGSVLSPAAVAVAGVSFVAYLCAACWACSLSTTRPLETEAREIENHSKHRFKRLTWALLVFGALFGLLVIGTTHLRTFEHSGSLLRILSPAAMLTWVLGFFLVLAPALRHRRPWPQIKASRGAALVWLLVIGLGVFMFLVTLSD